MFNEFALGHYIAFCYDATAQAIAVQFNIKVRVGKVLSYFSEFSSGSDYSYLPLLSEASVEKFGRERPKRLLTKVARIQDFEGGGESTDFEDALEDMGRMFGAPMIETVISSNLADRPLLPDAVISTVRRLLRIREEHPERVKKLQAETFEEQDPYNFLQQLIKEKETLEMPENSPNESRAIRMAFLRRAYEKHKRSIRRSMGAQ